MAKIGTIFKNKTTKLRLNEKITKDYILILFKNDYCKTQFVALFVNENPDCENYTIISIEEVGNNTNDVDLSMGIVSFVTSGTWDIEIYEQDSYTNLVTSLADFVYSGSVQVTGQSSGVSPFAPNTATVIDSLNPNSPISLKPGESYPCTDCPDIDLSFAYPISGQTTIYATSGGVSGDDAFYEQNVIAALRAAGTENKNGLIDFFTLDGNNKWGNTNRFTDTLGTQVYANNIIQDHFTGWEIYGVAQGGTGADSWNSAIPASLGTDYAGGTNATEGFTDWVMIPESVMSCIQNLEIGLLDYAPFNLSQNFICSSSRNGTFTLFFRTTADTVQLNKTTTGIFYLFGRPIDL